LLSLLGGVLAGFSSPLDELLGVFGFLAKSLLLGLVLGYVFPNRWRPCTAGFCTGYALFGLVAIVFDRPTYYSLTNLVQTVIAIILPATGIFVPCAAGLLIGSWAKAWYTRGGSR